MRAKLGIVLVVGFIVLLAGTVMSLAQEAEKTATPTPSAEKGEQEATKQEVKKIDINSATVKELETLPGIGPKMAQAIIDQRPYEKVEDIMNVKGIGEKKFAAIKDLIEAKPIKNAEEEQTQEGVPTSAQNPKSEEKPKEESTPKK